MNINSFELKIKMCLHCKLSLFTRIRIPIRIRSCSWKRIILLKSTTFTYYSKWKVKCGENKIISIFSIIYMRIQNKHFPFPRTLRGLFSVPCMYPSSLGIMNGFFHLLFCNRNMLNLFAACSKAFPLMECNFSAERISIFFFASSIL